MLALNGMRLRLSNIARLVLSQNHADANKNVENDKEKDNDDDRTLMIMMVMMMMMMKCTVYSLSCCCGLC